VRGVCQIFRADGLLPAFYRLLLLPPEGPGPGGKQSGPGGGKFGGSKQSAGGGGGSFKSKLGAAGTGAAAAAASAAAAAAATAALEAGTGPGFQFLMPALSAHLLAYAYRDAPRWPGQFVRWFLEVLLLPPHPTGGSWRPRATHSLTVEEAP
jgi:hypothetical protein